VGISSARAADARLRERVVAELRRRQEQAAASEFTAYWARLADRPQGAAAIHASPEPPSTTATPAPVPLGIVSP
jgi:hypothetical protein